MKQIAIMQPYFFPYVGYFQLIASSNTFVFLDNVNHIKRGWVHRNRILVNGSPSWIALNLIKASQNKKINEIEILHSDKETGKALKGIEMNYKKAPFYKEVFPVVESILKDTEDNLSKYLEKSIIKLSHELKINTEFMVSSQFPEYESYKGEDKILAISKKLAAESYINPPGGADLYSKIKFRENNINLNFLEPKICEYEQFGKEFVPYLSIIDILMHNGFNKASEMVNV